MLVRLCDSWRVAEGPCSARRRYSTDDASGPDLAYGTLLAYGTGND